VAFLLRCPGINHILLAQSLKQNRNNWRVWVSKLYTCIDLKRYDESIQTCNELLNLRARRNEIPNLEERCIRAIMKGSLQNYYDARTANDDIPLDSAKRTLNRLKDLLEKMKSSMKSEVWLFDTSAYLNSELGLTEEVYDDLMKEYRTLQSVKGWENDQGCISQMTRLVRDIFVHHKKTGTKENMVKCKLMISGVANKIRNACECAPPQQLKELEALQSDIENLVDD